MYVASFLGACVGEEEALAIGMTDNIIRGEYMGALDGLDMSERIAADIGLEDFDA